MADVKHTPGPWEFDGKARVDAVALRKPTAHEVMSDDGTSAPFMGGLVALPYSCHPDNNDYSVGTHRANALLIAAAPDLLEALIECLECEFAVTDKAAIAKATAAIAKATGGAARATEGSAT